MQRLPCGLCLLILCKVTLQSGYSQTYSVMLTYLVCTWVRRARKCQAWWCREGGAWRPVLFNAVRKWLTAFHSGCGTLYPWCATVAPCTEQHLVLPAFLEAVLTATVIPDL